MNNLPKKSKFSVPFQAWLERCYELREIENFYQDRRANRSQVPLINHIYEGIDILNFIGSTPEAMRAFAFHPLLQDDTDLSKFYEQCRSYVHIESKILLLAMEYRSIANSYLSKHTAEDFKRLKLSPLKEVNQMLIADKVQNYKDFCLYHKNTHPNSKRLDEYFNQWFEILSVSKKQYEELCDKLINENYS